MMSSLRGSLLSGSAGEETSLDGDGTGIVSGSANSPTVEEVEIKTVWDFEKIEKRGGADPASRCWCCGWCGLVLKGWNATKALNHVSKAKGNNDVKACTGSIPPATLVVFQAFRLKKFGTTVAKRGHKESFAESIATNQQSISVMFEAQRSRSSKSAEIVDMTGPDSCDNVGASNSSKLTSAIAEFVFSKGLPFSVTEGDHFQQILRLCRLVPPSYRPPQRKVLSNELLQLCYDNRMAKYMTDLDIDAEVYGLSLFGDGATVHGMPLMNILASGVSEPCAVLAIVDCKCVVDCCLCFLFASSFALIIFLLPLVWFS
jgi:hypothetical protein